MKKEMNPAVVVIVIVVVVAVVGFFIWRGSAGDAANVPPGGVGNASPFEPGGEANKGQARPSTGEAPVPAAPGQ